MVETGLYLWLNYIWLVVQWKLLACDTVAIVALVTGVWSSQYQRCEIFALFSLVSSPVLIILVILVLVVSFAHNFGSYMLFEEPLLYYIGSYVNLYICIIRWHLILFDPLTGIPLHCDTGQDSNQSKRTNQTARLPVAPVTHAWLVESVISWNIQDVHTYMHYQQNDYQHGMN